MRNPTEEVVMDRITKYGFALVAAGVALWVGLALAAAQPGGDSSATAAANRPVVRELRSMKRELRKLNDNIGSRQAGGRVLERLGRIEASVGQTSARIGESTMDLGSVRGLLKAICLSLALPEECG
jgi:hypothetical protein